MNTDIKNFLINVISGLLTAIVFLYLKKNGLTSPAYIVFVLYLFLILFVGMKFLKSKSDNNLYENEDVDKKENLETHLDHLILKSILELRSLNQVASPENIANKPNQDAGIILAHLNKLHNEQYVSFQTGGKPPTHKTNFFLSPNALKTIELFDIRQKQKRRVIHPGISK